MKDKNIHKERELYLPEGFEATSRIGDVMGRGEHANIYTEVLKSKAFKSLSLSSKATYQYFIMSKTTETYPVYVKFQYRCAVEYGICASPATFVKIKKEFVEYGIMDQVETDDYKPTQWLKLSSRWRWYGSEHFIFSAYTTSNEDREIGAL